jgi:hypothetical protein
MQSNDIVHIYAKRQRWKALQTKQTVEVSQRTDWN